MLFVLLKQLDQEEQATSCIFFTLSQVITQFNKFIVCANDQQFKLIRLRFPNNNIINITTWTPKHLKILDSFDNIILS
jgi:hypothetical protein